MDNDKRKLTEKELKRKDGFEKKALKENRIICRRNY